MANDDQFARESFTMRRMEPWQIWAVGIFAVVAAIAMLIAVNMT